MKSARKFGFELEYASQTREMVRELHRNGLMQMSELHGYHCTCYQCNYHVETYDEDHECDAHCEDYGCWNEPSHNCRRRGCPRSSRTPVPGRLDSVPDLRAQTDSTADGEFITRPMDDWDDLQRIALALTTAATNAGATANMRCGLHVHVDTSDDIVDHDDYSGAILVESRLQKRRTTPAAYLAFERYFCEIVAPGASIRKRDMNSTLMQAARSYISNSYAVSSGPNAWMDFGRNEVDTILQQTISMDRHVDLNWSQRNSTWEFRCFNATNAPWRIELACRMAVAFVEATPALREAVENVVRGSKFWPVGCDSPWGEIIRPAFSELPAPHPTKRPVVPIEQFIDILCNVDPDLRPLIERQANFMRTRYAHEVVAAS